MMKCYHHHTSKAELLLKETIFFHFLRIGVAKPGFPKRSMHGLDKVPEKSINTCFVFSSNFQSFVARQINFPKLSVTEYQELHTWMSMPIHKIAHESQSTCAQ